VVLLTLEHALRHEHREVRVLNAELLDLVVEPACGESEDAELLGPNGARWIVSQMPYDHGLRM
jgi:hypothetical protein